MIQYAILALTLVANASSSVPAAAGGAGGALLSPFGDREGFSRPLGRGSTGAEVSVEAWVKVATELLPAEESVLVEIGDEIRVYMDEEGVGILLRNERVVYPWRAVRERSNFVQEWTHVAFSGPQLFLNGEIVVREEEFVANVSFVQVLDMPPSPQDGEAWEGCSAVDGGAPDELRDCVIPFRIRGGRQIRECLPLENSDDNLVPFMDDSIQDVPELSFWCPTERNYNKRNRDSRLNWGFCDCPFFENATFAGNSARLGALYAVETFETLQPLYDSNATATPRQSLTLIALPFGQELPKENFLVTESFAVLLYSDVSSVSLPTKEDVKALEDAGASAVLIISDVSDGLRADLTCLEVQAFKERLNESYRCHALNVSRATVPPFNGIVASNRKESSNCSQLTVLSPSNAFDGKINTVWAVNLEEDGNVLLDYLYETPQPAFFQIDTYSFVSAPSFAKAPSSWTLEALVSTVSLQEWILIDQRENISWSNSGAEARHFRLPVASFTDADQILGYRFSFHDDESGNLALAEVGLLNLAGFNETSIFFEDGAINSSSYFAGNDQIRNMDIVHLRIPVFYSQFDERMYDLVTGDTSLIPQIVFRDRLLQQSLDPLHENDLVTIGRDFVGEIDEVRIFDGLRSQEAVQAILNVSLTEFLGFEGLLFVEGFDDMLSTSTAPIFGSPLDVFFPDTETRNLEVDVFGILNSDTDNFDFRITKEPTYGSLRNVDFRNPNRIERDVVDQIGSMQYRKSSSASTDNDIFAVEISFRGGSVETEIRVFVVPPLGANFTSRRISLQGRKFVSLVFPGTKEVSAYSETIFKVQGLSFGSLTYIDSSRIPADCLIPASEGPLLVFRGNQSRSVQLQFTFASFRSEIGLDLRVPLLPPSIDLPDEEIPFSQSLDFKAFIGQETPVDSFRVVRAPVFFSPFQEDGVTRVEVGVVAGKWVFANRVLGFSSQFSSAGDFSATQALGKPDFFPLKGNSGRGWKPRASSPDGVDFIELGLEESVHVQLVEVYEVNRNGASLQRILVGEEVGNWHEIWTAERLDASLERLAVCPSRIMASAIRLEFDSSESLEVAVLDALRVFGTFQVGSGLLTGNGVLSLVPEPGIAASDDIEFLALNCDVESERARIVVASPKNWNSTRFKVQPNILMRRGTPKNASSMLTDLNVSWAFVLEDLLERIANAGDSVTFSSDAKLTVRFMEEGSEELTFAWESRTTNAVLQLPMPRSMTSISAGGNASLVEVHVSFTGLHFFGEERTIDYFFDAELTLDCFETETFGVCAQNRKIIPGICTDPRSGRRNKLCECHEEPSLERYVAGQACELTTWQSCNGRGTPIVDQDTGDARCVCFDEESFGGRLCDKRAGPVKDLADLVAEVEVIKAELERGTTRALEVAVSDAEDQVFLVVVESRGSRRMQQGNATDNSEAFLLAFNLTEELNPEGTCNGNGRPTSTGECICDGFFEPPDCFTETRCELGFYIVKIPNPDSDGSGSVPDEIGECRLCEPGFSCDSRIRQECPSGTFAHEAGMSFCRDRCISDAEFMVQDPESINGIRCETCPAGSFCDGRNSTLCRLGSFAPQPGLTQCIECNNIGSAFYADATGSTMCKECPRNSNRINSPGISRDECVCRLNFWNRNASNPLMNGLPCVPCPDNGVCRGNSQNENENAVPPYHNVGPFPSEGYWGDPNAPQEFFECEEQSRCLGTKEFLCRNGTEGIFCGECSRGWYSLGSCLRCPNGGGTGADIAFVIFCWAAVIVAWVILNKVSNEVRALDIALLFAQLVFIVQSFQLVWPFPVNILNTPFEITGFEVDYFSPNCWWESWDYLNRFLLQFFLPVIYAVFNLLWLGAAKLHYRKKVGSSESKTVDINNNESPTGDTASSPGTIMSNEDEEDEEVADVLKRVLFAIVNFFDLPDNAEEYKASVDKSIGLFFNFCLVVYPSLVITFLTPFRCVELPSGQNVMEADPRVSCWSREHVSNFVILSFVGLAVYVVGIPAFQYWVLTHGDKNDLKADPEFLARWSWMYCDFKHVAYRWECLLTFRRFAFSFILVLAASEGYVQATAASVVIVFCLTIQVLYQPFLSRRINVLDQASMFAVFLYIFLGVIFSAYEDRGNNAFEMIYFDVLPSNGDEASTIVTVLAWLLLFLTLGTVALGFLVSYLDARDVVRVLKAEANLFKRAKTEEVALVRTVRGQPEERSVLEVMGLLHDLDVAQTLRKSNDLRNETSFRDVVVRMMQPGSPRRSRTENPSNSSTNSSKIRLGSLRLRRKTNRDPNESSLFRRIATSHGNKILPKDLLRFITGELFMDGESYRVQLENLFREYDVDGSGYIDAHEFARMIHDNLVNVEHSELKAAYKSKYLIRWALSEHCAPLQVCLFFELDALVRNMIRDDGPVSVYRGTAIAKFYRKIVDAFPFLLDWLMVAEEDDIKSFARILRQWQECIDHVGPHGSVSKVVAVKVKAPFAFWLINKAHARDRLVFKAVTSSIITTAKHELQIYERRGNRRGVVDINSRYREGEAAVVIQRAARKFLSSRKRVENGESKTDDHDDDDDDDNDTILEMVVE